MENVKGADRVEEIRGRVQSAARMYGGGIRPIDLEDRAFLLSELDEMREWIWRSAHEHRMAADALPDSHGDVHRELAAASRAFLQREGEG